MHHQNPRATFVARWTLAVCSLLAASAVFAECPSGMRGVDPQCDVLFAREERALKTVEEKMIAHLAKAYADPEYGNGSEGSYLAMATENFRQAEKTWRSFREAECLYLPLLGGMSIGYDGEVFMLCKIDMTRQRRKALEKMLPKSR